MGIQTELECPTCKEDFKVDWLFGDEVTCPLCKQKWETEWDTDSDDNIYGPWIVS